MTLQEEINIRNAGEQACHDGAQRMFGLYESPEYLGNCETELNNKILAMKNAEMLLQAKSGMLPEITKQQQTQNETAAIFGAVVITTILIIYVLKS